MVSGDELGASGARAQVTPPGETPDAKARICIVQDGDEDDANGANAGGERALPHTPRHPLSGNHFLSSAIRPIPSEFSIAAEYTKQNGYIANWYRSSSGNHFPSSAIRPIPSEFSIAAEYTKQNGYIANWYRSSNREDPKKSWWKLIEYFCKLGTMGRFVAPCEARESGSKNHCERSGKLLRVLYGFPNKEARSGNRALGQMHSVGAAQRARERLGGRKQAADSGQQTAGQQWEVQRAQGQAAAGGGTGGGRQARSGRRVARWDEAGGGGRRLAHPYFVQP
ncbi:hypothetical protein GGX14DRAFT_406653 [Mycena pura]|uniref:Uncharacterized protein n=1 Tax=Mycena pura TaxID=153505 RepID=A0AAD6UPN4_9AGAR|nr:hypothetical protein GGX14DRAFT_406653 [Mycena pura]